MKIDYVIRFHVNEYERDKEKKVVYSSIRDNKCSSFKYYMYEYSETFNKWEEQPTSDYNNLIKNAMKTETGNNG